jgi:hypothetical protein
MASIDKRAAKVLPPDVHAALAAAVKRLKKQSLVAKDLGVSGAVVSALLSNSYQGDVPTLAARIRGKYMAETVQCPVMGTLGRDHCLDNQARPLVFTNPLRASLFRACKTCPNRKELA